eukprot:SAG11_NODE_5171_length_1641_cov_0.921530_2_plen_57_part_00
MKLEADWGTMVGKELYDYRGVDMTDFDQFDRVNIAGKLSGVEQMLSKALRSNYDQM